MNMAGSNLLCNIGLRRYFYFSLTTLDIQQNNISFVFIYFSLYYGRKEIMVQSKDILKIQ
jgi:hypothetical protein